MLGFPNASNSTAANSTTGLQGAISSYTTQTGATQASTGGAGYCLKYVVSGNICFGANFVARDFTGRKSSISGGGLANEFDEVASGPDDAPNRAGLTVEFGENGPSADGATTFEYGFLLRPMAAGAQVTPNSATVLAGYNAITMGQTGGVNGYYGAFGDAYNLDGGETIGGYDIHTGVLSFATTVLANSGQPDLIFAPNTNINVGQQVSGSASIPTGTTVSAVYQCWATQPLAGCAGATNETLVMLSANLTGSIASATSLTFTGVVPDGSYFSGVFSDAFTYWANQAATGKIKAGTTNNSGTALVIEAMGNDSAGATGVDYGDIQFGIATNTHGAVVGNINLAPAGSGQVKVNGAPLAASATIDTTSAATFRLARLRQHAVARAWSTAR